MAHSPVLPGVTAHVDLIDCVTDAIVVLDGDFGLRFANAAARKLVSGARDGAVPEGGAADLVAAADRQRVTDVFAQLVRDPGGMVVVEFDVRTHDGFRPVEATATNLLGTPGVDGVVVCFRDLSGERRSTKRADRLMAALEASSDLVMVHDGDGGVLDCNVAARRFLGARTSVEELYPPPTRRWLMDEAVASAADDAVTNRDGVILDEIGRPLDVSLVVTVRHDAAGAVESFAVIARDLTERKLLEADLTYRASHDQLTGLLNRVGVVSALEHLRTDPLRPRESVLLFIDLDDFKAVNDTLGHEAGDHVLTVVAERLRHAVRPSDLLARWSGDEFLVVLTGADANLAERTADRVQHLLDSPITFDGTVVRTTASIGVSVGVPTGAGEQLIRHADLAMYEAKRQGKNQTAFYSG